MSGVNYNTIDTINAAATAISSSENRTPHSSSVQKRRWGSFWSISSCFGSQKPNNKKKISHAVLVPEPSLSRTEVQGTQNPTQSSSVVLPFIAPPSSPASFLQSAPPSAVQSPGGLLSFTAASSGMYSPSDPSNMFAVGPYANETQLVSPPAFSTYTTEPSTASFTPPPESVHLTTPSSPEVPFARFLGSANQNGQVDRKFSSPHQEFQMYQLYPGSPMGQLISPGSCVTNSGTSSPYGDIPHGGPPFLNNPSGGKLWPPGWKSLQESGATTPDPYRPGSVLDRQNSDVGPLTNFANDDQHTMVNHRVSFEITPEEVVRCVERRLTADMANARDSCSDDMTKGHRSTATFGSGKEFNFGSSTDGAESNWWTSEKVLGKETGSGPIKNWAFFPMIQPGVS
ncbi:uncharacterized protein [Rutidosis leptorrhynchoides]|uniref:uncharacterized protein n=1 Tax=Rutidosis leptorrhynchoides TaxID=125765 RepID=UPI003A9A07B8